MNMILVLVWKRWAHGQAAETTKAARAAAHPAVGQQEGGGVVEAGAHMLRQGALGRELVCKGKMQLRWDEAQAGRAAGQRWGIRRGIAACSHKRQ
jgi:hypothetical protein